MNAFLTSLPAFIVALGVLITVHEYGHFWVARRLGVRVLRFSIGFGPALWRRQARDGTEYVIAALPLGGYVKMLDEQEGEVQEDQRVRAFNRKPLAARSAIVAAGPLANLALAVVAYWLMFASGVSGLRPVVGGVEPNSPAAVAGLAAGDEIMAVGTETTPTWEAGVFAMLQHALASGTLPLQVRTAQGESEQRLLRLDPARVAEDVDLLNLAGIRPWQPAMPAVIDRLEPGGVAERAGLRPGDRLIGVDGVAIKEWSQWVEWVRGHPEKPARVELERAGARLAITLTPQRIAEAGGWVGRIGAYGRPPPPETYQAMQTVHRYAPLPAIAAAFDKTSAVIRLTFTVLGKMLVGQASLDNISGPISIAEYAGHSARAGFASFLGFLAVLSVSLGVLNLMPIPVLDGGHLLYYLIEFLKGSPLSITAQQAGQRIGLVALLALMTLALYNDVLRLLS